MEAYFLAEDGINLVGGDDYRFCSWGCLVSWILQVDHSRNEENSESSEEDEKKIQNLRQTDYSPFQ